jgi:hypothetical protein
VSCTTQSGSGPPPRSVTLIGAREGCHYLWKNDAQLLCRCAIRNPCGGCMTGGLKLRGRVPLAVKRSDRCIRLQSVGGPVRGSWELSVGSEGRTPAREPKRISRGSVRGTCKDVSISTMAVPRCAPRWVLMTAACVTTPTTEKSRIRSSTCARGGSSKREGQWGGPRKRNVRS